MYGIHTEKGYSEILPGIKIKNLCVGDNMNLTEFVMQKGAALPAHSHTNEQTGYLVKGKIKLTIGSESRVLSSGDSWNIKTNVTHKAEILEDSVAIEVFNPLREDYNKFLNADDIHNHN
jgi:quercetin dioxygenase-like cupin family protein